MTALLAALGFVGLIAGACVTVLVCFVALAKAISRWGEE